MKRRRARGGRAGRQSTDVDQAQQEKRRGCSGVMERRGEERIKRAKAIFKGEETRLG